MSGAGSFFSEFRGDIVAFLDDGVLGFFFDGSDSPIALDRYESDPAEELVATVGTYTVANIGSPVYALDSSLPYSHDNTDSATVGELGQHDGAAFHVIFRGVNAL